MNLVACIVTVHIISGLVSETIRTPLDGVVLREFPKEYVIDVSEDLSKQGFTLLDGIEIYKSYVVDKNECVKR